MCIICIYEIHVYMNIHSIMKICMYECNMYVLKLEKEYACPNAQFY